MEFCDSLVSLTPYNPRWPPYLDEKLGDRKMLELNIWE